MQLVKKMMFIFILTGFTAAPVFAVVYSSPNQGIFTSVSGKVEVKAKKGHKTKKAQKDLTVFEGDRIITYDNSSATLRLFDGSSLDISSKTEFVLSKLKKPSAKDKILQFRLIVGKLLAAVEKLTTSKSSFEIEAGGVVCGVRGTKFSLECDGKTKPQVQLHVFEGVVYAIDAKGNKFFFNPGPLISFFNALKVDIPKQSGVPGNNSMGLKDLNDQFKSNVGMNQNRVLNVIQGGSNLTIKPYVGN